MTCVYHVPRVRACTPCSRAAPRLSSAEYTSPTRMFRFRAACAFCQTEATEVFFAVTKLFQSKDPNLRRMVYLIIKEISPSSDEARRPSRRRRRNYAPAPHRNTGCACSLREALPRPERRSSSSRAR